MRVMLNIAAMVLVSSLGFGNVALAADDGFGARFVDAAPSAFGDPSESGVNYDAFAMDDATAAMLNDVMPASGDENEAEEQVEDIHVEADHIEGAHDEHHDHDGDHEDDSHEDDSYAEAEDDQLEEDSESEE